MTSVTMTVLLTRRQHAANSSREKWSNVLSTRKLANFRL